ncbi:MAG: HAD family hydrolase [Alicyclobacillaceae bacterium]|nr:HAD family hydrolase [Alicyclobacillaceae bacterium]
MPAKPRRRFEVIFFDLDHTLVDTHRQYLVGLQQTLDALYGGHLPSDFRERFLANHDRLWEAFDARQITIQELRRQRFLQTWREFGEEKTVADAEAFQQAFDATFNQTLRAFPHTDTMLAELADTFRLAILSNGSADVVRRKLDVLKLSKYFPSDWIFIAEEIGPSKPDRAVFLHACRAVGLEPSRCLMVGDNYRCDILGARASGLTALWYVPEGAGVDVSLGRQSGEEPVVTAAEVVAAIRNMEDG